MYLDKLDGKSAAGSSRPRPASGGAARPATPQRRRASDERRALIETAVDQVSLTSQSCELFVPNRRRNHKEHRGYNLAREGPPLAESFIRPCSRHFVPSDRRQSELMDE